MTEEQLRKLDEALSECPFLPNDTGKLVRMKFPRHTTPYGGQLRPLGIIIGSEDKRGQIVRTNASNVKAIVFFDQPDKIIKLHNVALEYVSE